MRCQIPSARTRKLPGFTLIELLTVIAIIGILAAILVPTVSKVRSTAKKTQCVARLRQWGNAVGLLANDYKGHVALFYKSDASTTTFIYDPYLNRGKLMVDNVSAGGNTRELLPTEAMTQCPNGLKGGSTTTGQDRQYAFVIPKGLTKRTSGTLQKTNADYYFLMNEAASPAKLAFMVESAESGTSAVIEGDDISTQLSTNVRKTQTTEGWIRHGGVAHVLFLDGHVAGLSTTDTNYSDTTSKRNWDQWTKLK